MNENSEKNISGNPGSQNRNITDDQLQIDTQLQDANRQGPRRSASSGAVDMQFATALDRLTMPTPEAAKMARYADFPVSPSLGTADISIPIYEINTGRLRLPISLQYSTSGIKVNEISGPVGLGWHLNAGGVITRTICGVKDGEPGYLEMRGMVTENIISNPHHDGAISQGTNDILSTFASGGGDTQYDRYSYSFLGHTGSFIIRDFKVVVLTPTDLKIEMPGTGGVMFRITDTHGTVYDFGVEETSSKYVSSPSPTPLAPSNTCGMGFPTNTPTSWHLRSITSMDGMDNIRFEYETDNETVQNEFITTRNSYHKTYRLSYKYFNSYNGASWEWKAISGTGAVQYASGITPDIVSDDWRYEISEGYRPRMLKRIVFRGGSVDLAYEDNEITASSNIRRSYKKHLLSVSVTSTDGSSIRSAVLAYSQTGLSDRRELLSSVTFKGTDGTTYDSRTMEYYDPGTVMLPQAQDLFGYYNGATGNTTLVPFKMFSDNYTINEVYGDRTYSAYYAKALSLKSITTASGAYTEIQYEGNSVQAPSSTSFTPVLPTIGIGIRVARIITGNMTGTGNNRTLNTVRTRTFSYDNPVLTIPAADFTHNRFITASECCTALETSQDRTWEGIYGPERTCTITIGDQSVHGGAPLESAMIVYGKVSEKVSDPSGNTWQRTEYTFDAGACVKERLWDVTYLPESHDSTFSDNCRPEDMLTYGWGFHFLQRVPNLITRYGLSPSVMLTPPSYLFTEANCPMMTLPTQVRKFSRKAGEAEKIIEKTVYTYETGSDEVLTGFTVRNLISLMNDSIYGSQNTNYMCLSDYKQTEFKTRVVLARVSSCETTTYNDGTTDAVAEGTTAMVNLERRFYGSSRWRRTSEHSAQGTPHAVGYDDMRYPAMPIDTTSLTNPGTALGPSVIMTTVEGDSSAARTRCLLRVCDFDSSEASQTHQHTTTIPNLDELYTRHYMEPIGEEVIYGELVKIEDHLFRPSGLEDDSRFIYFSIITRTRTETDENGENPHSAPVECVVPVRQKTFRNGTLVRTDWEITGYDAMDNPAEIKSPGMPTRVILWGYGGLYPIADIEGMERTDVLNYRRASSAYPIGYLHSQALSSAAPPSDLYLALESLATESGVSVRTSRYRTLVGPTTVSDQTGAAGISDYDSAGRLSSQRRREAGADGNGDLVADWIYDFMQSDNVTDSIRQRTYTAAGASTSTARTVVTRYDGMGRTVQTSHVGASPSGGDIVQPFAPDFLDRENAVSYLPYREASSNGGAYRSNALSQQSSFYDSMYGAGMGQRASSRKNYEPSSRNKVESALLPGHDPDSDSEKTVTTVNGITSADVLKIRTDADITTGTPASNIIKDGHWQAGSLVKTTTTGPDGSVTQVFANEFGSPVLERRLISGTVTSSPVWSSAYYVRDIRDRVVCVVTPDEYDALVVGSASSRSASGCYVYMYDNQDRVIYRKLPNCTATSVEYDEAGRITKETTGNRIFSNEYDSLGRLLKRKYRYGASGTEITLIEYGYDIYEPSQMGGLSFSAVSGIVASGDIMSQARGMKTREKVLALKPEYSDSEVATGTGTYIYRAFYYDKLGRLVQTAKRNILGQTCRVSTKYDFTGNPVLIRETQQTVFGSGNEVSADTALTYDREGRITGMSVTLSPVTATASYGYDSIGRPITRTLGSTSSPAAVITDSYTIQGWLSQRSSTPFTSQLRYDNPAHGATPGTPGLAGNITEWKTFRNGSTANGSTYAFTYDLMSRLKSSSRYAGNSATATSPYTEKDITYFADSRIKTMKRYGASASSVQSLSFATDTNTYDSFRNVTNDATSGTSIEWNILNLPRKMTTSGGVVSEYTYLADGTKIRMKSETTTWHYLGSMVFSQAGSASPVFESMAFSEGRIVVNSSGSKEVHYHITDHLGSVRSVVKADGTVIATNDYYPYGKRINTASATTPTQKDRHTFSGKEDQALTPGGAPYLDFGARMYSAETGRWLSVDPMAEKYYGIGTHVYCAGNSVILRDPDGKNPLVGALVGAGLDLANQITINIINGKHWSEIEGKDILIAAAAGAAGVGLISKTKEVKTLVKLGQTAINTAEVALETGVSAAESVAKQHFDGKTVSFKETLVDAGIGALSSGFGQGAKGLKRASSSQELKTLERQLDHAKRVAGDYPRSPRQAKVNDAKNQVENFGNASKDCIKSLTNWGLNVIKDLYE